MQIKWNVSIHSRGVGWEGGQRTRQYPLFEVGSPLVVLSDDYFNSSLPAFALGAVDLRRRRAVTQCLWLGGTDLLREDHQTERRMARYSLFILHNIMICFFPTFTSEERFMSDSMFPSRGVTKWHTGLALFSTSAGRKKQPTIKSTWLRKTMWRHGMTWSDI